MRASCDAGPGSCRCPEADAWTWWGEEVLRLVAPFVTALTRGVYPSIAAWQAHRWYDRAMRSLAIWGGVLLILSGLVWIAQGLDLPFAPHSFMTSDRAWIAIGAATVLAGAIALGWGLRRA